MAGIRSKDTNPELAVRKALHALGYRYRLHSKLLPGKPDLVLAKYRAIIFVHGCFWHGHDCSLFKLPSSRTEFWKDKISGNRARDARIEESLLALGWRLLTIWECALKGRGRLGIEEISQRTDNWLTSGALRLEIRGIV